MNLNQLIKFCNINMYRKGYGYDDPDSKMVHGHNVFRRYIGKYDYKDDIDLIKVFNDAKEKYPYDKADLPMMVCKYKKYFI